MRVLRCARRSGARVVDALAVVSQNFLNADTSNYREIVISNG